MRPRSLQRGSRNSFRVLLPQECRVTQSRAGGPASEPYCGRVAGVERSTAGCGCCAGPELSRCLVSVEAFRFTMNSYPVMAARRAAHGAAGRAGRRRGAGCATSRNGKAIVGAAGLAIGFGEQPRLRSNEDLSHHLTGTRICSAPESAVKPKASGQDSESTARREPGGDRATATHSERCRCLPIGQQHPKESVSKISRIRVIGQERTHQTTQAAYPPAW